jgi:peroxiredoxin Q/BCP
MFKQQFLHLYVTQSLVTIPMFTPIVVALMVASGNPTPTVGSHAPEFTAPSTSGELSLKSLRGKWVVLYFYPKAFTPGCTAESCSLRDGFDGLRTLDAVVIGVSTDDLNTQRKFKEKYALPFELVADSDKRVVKAYDVSGMLGFAKRRTFIIDPDGIIRHIIEDVDTGKHAEQVRQILETLRAKKDTSR